MKEAISPSTHFGLEAAVVEKVVSRALEEDVGSGDVTTSACVEPEALGVGRMVAKEAGIAAGLPVAGAVFQRVEASLAVRQGVAEGQAVGPGAELLVVEGPLAAQLVAERVALNFVQRLSGIATLTRRCVDAASSYGVTILDTRKTTPGLRALERYAVRVGGGENYRAGLFDLVLIKDNHIAAAGGLRPAVERAREAHGERYPVIVEVSNLEELAEVLELDLDRIMLDNFPIEAMREAVRAAEGRTPLEASGGITPETIHAVAACGVDYISVGALTQAAPPLDISFSLSPSALAPSPGRDVS